MIPLRSRTDLATPRAGLPPSPIGVGLVRPPVARPMITPTGGPTFQPGQRPPAPGPAVTPGIAPGGVPMISRPGNGTGPTSKMDGFNPMGMTSNVAPTPAAPVAGGTGTATGGPAIQPGQSGAPATNPGIVPPAAPAPSVPGASMTAIDPAHDLRSQQILPGADPRLATRQGQVDAAVGDLATGPNRTELAQKTLADFDAANKRGLDERFLNIGQQAAKFGRLGYGGNEVAAKDLGLEYEAQRGRLANELASNVASGDIADRFQKVGALSGLESQQFGEGSAMRDEARGERGYQYGAASDATDRAVQQRRLEEDLLNSQFGREATKAGYAGDLGRVQGGLAAEHAAAAGGAAQDIGALLQAYMARKAAPAGVAPSGINPTGTIAPDEIDWNAILGGGALG